LSLAFNINQATSPDYHSFIRTLQEAYRKTKDGRSTYVARRYVLIDDRPLQGHPHMFKSGLYNTFAPVITQLDAERVTPAVNGQPPQLRRLDQPFVRSTG
jgi:hypothetical protein